MLKAAKAYLNTQVTTASKGDLLLMLYDTAIKHLKLAQEKMREKDYAAKGILITKALDIIGELQSSLNKERGGEVAQNLFKLYFVCNTRLLQANMNMDIKLVEDVINILGGLRQSFAQIIPTYEGTKTNSVAPFAESDTASKAPVPGAKAAPVAEATAGTSSLPATGQGDAVPTGTMQPAPAAPPAPTEPAQPVQTIRYRAANAYANSR